MTSLQLRATPNNVGTIPFYGLPRGSSFMPPSQKDLFSDEQKANVLSDALSTEYQKIDDLEQRIKEMAKNEGLPEELFANELLSLKNARQIIGGFIEQCQGLMNQIIRNIG